ncbi:MAG: TetR/AcrR family transcriptional regulator [Planctomycetota bacterium]|nr:MAG: TetR/AcrR family transcriptional regulator [Planctomycetota bacterium]
MAPRKTIDSGRGMQRLRTRKDLLRAAAKLVQEGRQPTLDEIAAAALVSRATAYRYFSSAEAVLAEVGIDMLIPDAAAHFADDPSTDAFERVWKAERAINAPTFEHHLTARMALSSMLRQSVATAGARDGAPVRQNRRGAMIAAALAPVRDQFKRRELEHLSSALALFLGIESMVVFKDVLRLDDEQATAVRRWAVRALVDAARKSAGKSTGKPR